MFTTRAGILQGGVTNLEEPGIAEKVVEEQLRNIAETDTNGITDLVMEATDLRSSSFVAFRLFIVSQWPRRMITASLRRTDNSFILTLSLNILVLCVSRLGSAASLHFIIINALTAFSVEYLIVLM